MRRQQQPHLYHLLGEVDSVIQEVLHYAVDVALEGGQLQCYMNTKEMINTV